MAASVSDTHRPAAARNVLARSLCSQAPQPAPVPGCFFFPRQLARWRESHQRCAAVRIAFLVLGLTCAVHAQGIRVHQVRAGETLAEIAHRYHVGIETLQNANHLRGDRIREGQELRVPRAGTGSSARRYRVREGDTIAQVARRHRVSQNDVRIANNLRSNTLRPGQVLFLPRDGQSASEVRAEIRGENQGSNERPELDPVVEQEAAQVASECSLGPTPAGQRLLREPATPEQLAAAGDASEMDGTLLLPIEGAPYLRGWGSGADGYHLAIDMGSPPGTPVHAAERGIVAYAGNGIRGYGNFVILLHPNGWVTAYAHHTRNMVVAGQRVQRGDVVGLVGSTGFAQGPHLHFMLVYQGRHCDPMPLFRPQITRADGTPVADVEAVWDAELRPSVIQCLFRDQRPHPHYRRRHRGG
jgi:murein DD-endopeptidase MepM/ murein hydrolase activator NlpD